MNANKTAVAVALLAGAVIGSSLWICSVDKPAEASESALPDANTYLSASRSATSDESANVFSFSAESAEAEPDNVSIASEPVRGTLGKQEETFSLQVRVTDAEGFALAGASVTAGGQEGMTDENGLFSVELQEQDIVLYIVAEGYVSYYEEIELSESVLTVALEKADKIRKLLDSAELHPYQTNLPELEQYLDTLFGSLFKPGMDTYDQVKACYDWLIDNMVYKRPNHEGSGYWACAYQALTTGIGTCDCYSAAFTAMMRHLGLNCYVVEGVTAANGGGYTGHYWTLIEIGGDYYIFDPQVEDAISGRTSSKEVTYLRFCLPEPNGKYVYSVRSRSSCIRRFEEFLEENGSEVVAQSPDADPFVVGHYAPGAVSLT